MRKATGRRTPRVDTSSFSLAGQRGCGGFGPVGRCGKFGDVAGHESREGVYKALHAEAGQSHGQDTSDPEPTARVAREGRTRRSAACNDGRGEWASPNHRAGVRMPATGNTPPKGDRTDGASQYEQVGRVLLAEELKKRREELVEQLESLEYHVERGRPVQKPGLWALRDEIEAIQQLLPLLAMASTEKAQEWYREEVTA